MIAITGANGLLGSYAVRKFKQENLPLRAVMRSTANVDLLKGLQLDVREADVLDMPSLLSAFEGATTVVHAAGFVSFNPRKRDLLHKVNVEGTANVVNACLKLGIPKLVHVSSVAALGRTKDNAHVSEESKWIPSTNNTHYAESKYLAELEIFRGMEEGLDVSLVNPSVVLAPAKSGQSSAQLFTYVAQERMFYGEGVINYVDVRDVASILVKLTQQRHTGERFIASAGAVPLKELLQQIAALLGKRKPTIKVPAGWAKVAALLEEARAALLGREPMLSRESVKILEETHYFRNEKVKSRLGIEFCSLEKSLQWCCHELNISG